MDLIDIGANLGHESFAGDLDAVLERADAAGVRRLVVTGASVAESERALEIAAARPGRLWATAGVHPHLADAWDEIAAAAIESLARTTPVVAVGETGLDFYRDLSPRDRQEHAFEAQLEIAAELGMPVFMHERDAHRRFVAVLGRHRDRIPRAVLHCFTGTAAELEAYVEMDLYIGITGWICDERRGTHLRELAARIPEERLLLETDAPYLLPRDLKPRPRSRRNEPVHLAHIAGVVAECVGSTAAEIAARTTANAERFFGIG